MFSDPFIIVFPIHLRNIIKDDSAQSNLKTQFSFVSALIFSYICKL